MYHSVRRICHASPASGGIASCSWVAAGAAVITPQHRYITYAAGFPPSPWEAVRKSHYSPYRSMRTGRCPGLQGFYVDRSASLSIWSPFHKLASWRRTLSRCCMVFVPAIPCIQFSKYNERHEVRALHLTQGNSRFLNSENCRTPIVHSLFTIFSMISKQA